MSPDTTSRRIPRVVRMNPNTKGITAVGQLRRLSASLALLTVALLLTGCVEIPFPEPRTPEPTAAPTLPHPTSADPRCSFGTFESGANRYWATVLKTVDAETLVLTNVNQSNAASPDTDDMNVAQYTVRLWGVIVPEGDKEQAAELRRKLTPPGSWVKVITIGEELQQDRITEISLANHHDWSLNLDLLRAGYAHLQDGIENECLVEAYWTGRPENERPKTPEPALVAGGQPPEGPYIEIALSPGNAVEMGTPIAVAVRFANLPALGQVDYAFQVQTITSVACDGDGAGLMRTIEWVEANVVEREAYISADCPAGEHKLLAMLAMNDTGEIIQQEVHFVVNAPPRPTDTPAPTEAPTLSPTPAPTPSPTPRLAEFGMPPESAGSVSEGVAAVLAACYIQTKPGAASRYLLFTDERRDLGGGPFLALEGGEAGALAGGTCYEFAAKRKGTLDWRMCADDPYGGCGTEDEEFLWHRDIPRFTLTGGGFRSIRQAW